MKLVIPATCDKLVDCHPALCCGVSFFKRI